jgi:hypothetical protein
MVYEALTAGCRVGVLPLSGEADNRIGKGIEQLATQGLVVHTPDWSMSGLAVAGAVFNEAERCAEVVLERGWLGG